MSMNITSTNGIKSDNYSIINDKKKSDNKNDITSNAPKSQGAQQELGSDTFIKSTEQETTNETYKPIKKKLSIEEIKILKDEEDNIKAEFMKKFISETINTQNKLLGRINENNEVPKETSDFLTKIFGSLESAYPPIETSIEGAKKAIEEGGAYSVKAVSDRIMTMAKFIAGDNPEKLQEMRDAVEKGFSQAGLEFNKATKSDLPQISKDTMAEVMKQFDKLQRISI